MNKLLFFALLLFSWGANAQNYEKNNIVRNNTLSPKNVANALDVMKPFTATGTNTYAITPGMDIYAGGNTYMTDDVWLVTIPNANTSTTVTLNVNGDGAIAVKDNAGNNPAIGDLKAGATYIFRYNGTHFRIVGSTSSGGIAAQTTMNNLPPEYQVNNYSLVPGDTSRLVLLKDALTTLTIGDFSSGVDGSQFIVYNETGATVTIDPSTYITKGPLEILDTTFAYIHFIADTFRISTATVGGVSPGGVTSVAVATGTTGTDVNVSGSPITTSGTITLNIPTASGTNRGALSSVDWTTFNGKQNAISFGTGVETWLTAPSWTNFNSAITGTAPYWSAANGVTMTGPNTITGTTTNILKANFDGLGVTQTNGAGWWLANNTAASSGNQQISPSLVLEGQGWGTTGGTSQSVKSSIDILPTQSTSPGLTFRLRSSINGAGYQEYFSVTNGGVMTVTTAGGAQVAKFNGQGLPIMQLGISANGLNAITNAGTSTISTAFGMQYTAAGGTTGSLNALHHITGPGSNITSWSATYNMLKIAPGTSAVQPSSGAGGWNSILIDPTYNVTGTSSGTIREVYVNPTNTSMTGIDHKAWEHTSGYIQWNSTTSPAQLTANADDYNPTGWTTVGYSVLRLSTDASRNLTSIAGGSNGRIAVIINVGSNDLVLKDDDGATGTAANRFALNADITLQADESVMIIYDGTSSRWRVLKN